MQTRLFGGSPPAFPSPAGEAVRSAIATCIAALARGDVDVVAAPGASRFANGVTHGTADDRAVRRDLWPCHSHATYEVCWVLWGRCILWLDGQAVSLGPNRACIICPDQMHQLRPTPQLDQFHTLWWSTTASGVLLFDSKFAGQQREVSAGFAPLERPAGQIIEVAARELQVRRPHYDLVLRAALLASRAYSPVLGRVRRGRGGYPPVPTSYQPTCMRRSNTSVRTMGPASPWKGWPGGWACHRAISPRSSVATRAQRYGLRQRGAASGGAITLAQYRPERHTGRGAGRAFRSLLLQPGLQGQRGVFARPIPPPIPRHGRTRIAVAEPGGPNAFSITFYQSCNAVHCHTLKRAGTLPGVDVRST